MPRLLSAPSGSIPSFAHTVGGTVTFSSTGSVLAPNVTLVNPSGPIIGGWATIGSVNNTVVGNTFDWATVNGSNQIVPLATYQAADKRHPAAPTTRRGQPTPIRSLSRRVTTPSTRSSFNGSAYGMNFTNNADKLTIVSGGIFSNNALGTGNYDNKAAIPNMTFVGSPDSGQLT